MAASRQRRLKAGTAQGQASLTRRTALNIPYRGLKPTATVMLSLREATRACRPAAIN
jgi:hypothetical protein